MLGVEEGVVAATASAAQENRIVVYRRSPQASLPRRATPQSAGLDLTSVENVIIQERGRAVVATDLTIILPRGTFGRIAPRSGLAVKHGIDVGAGIVDADYRGRIEVVLFNHTDDVFFVRQGDRIAQLIVQPCIMEDVVEETSDPSFLFQSTERGEKGFGSTGMQ